MSLSRKHKQAYPANMLIQNSIPRNVENRGITELKLCHWVDIIKVDVNEYARTMGSKTMCTEP